MRRRGENVQGERACEGRGRTMGTLCEEDCVRGKRACEGNRRARGMSCERDVSTTKHANVICTNVCRRQIRETERHYASKHV